MKRSRDEAFVLDDDDAQEHSRPRTRPRRSSTASSRTLSPEPPKRSPAENLNPQKTAQLASRFSSGARTSSTVPSDLRTLFPAREVKAEATHTPDKRPKQNAVKRESRPNIIDLDGDEDDDIPIFNPKGLEVIDLEEQSEQLENEIFGARVGAAEVKKLRARLSTAIRNPPVELPWITVDYHSWKGSSLKAKKTVELTNRRYCRITSVLRNIQTDSVRIRGLLLKKGSEIQGVLPTKANELYLNFEVDRDDPRSAQEQNILEFESCEIVKIRGGTKYTNKSFPECSWRCNDTEHIDTVFFANGKVDVEATNKLRWANEILVVRWKFTSFFKTATNRINHAGRQVHWQEQQIERLSEHECTPGDFSSLSLLRSSWRPCTILGGSREQKSDDIRNRRQPPAESRSANSFKLIDLTVEDDAESQRLENLQYRFSSLLQKDGTIKRQDEKEEKLKSATSTTGEKSFINGYTHIECFSGGGGSAQGAAIAGLYPTCAFDNCPIAGETFGPNFPEAKFFQLAADEFLNLPEHLHCQLHADVLHISCPCKYFSPAHRDVEAKNDGNNQAALSSVEELIKKIKPRITCLEQTYGILDRRFKAYFNMMIRMLVDQGYSVKWHVPRFEDYGLAHKRRRLIVVAAGPGEIIPDLPSVTHSKHGTGGLKPWITVRQVLASIPRNAPNHDLTVSGTRKDYTAWNDNQIYPYAITCLGATGKKYKRVGHPSGTRDFTVRELAALAGFPNNHIIHAKYITHARMIIGNAFAPSIAKLYFEQIRRSLEKSDKAELEKQRAAGGSV